MAKSILIVDDDPVQRRILEQLVKREGFIAHVADGGQTALKLLDGAVGDTISLVILDLVMPDLDGMGVLERLRPSRPRLPVIVQTAHGGIDNVVGAMRAGAIDFVVKPVSPERLGVSIRNALKVNALEGELTKARRQASGTLSFADIVTRAASMARVVQLGEKAAASTIPIMIEGESGVGKELIARAIQGSSARKGKPFVTVNCGAIPEHLVESILFGHEKGSFTGATEKHVGKFVEANGGTLFLDEVSELPLDTQVKLLRAIQEGEVDPVGAKKSIKVDIRLISATNRNMIEIVREGKFREDLYYRLNVFPVFIPPLRERLEDVPPLVDHFITRLSAEEGKRIDGIDPAALSLLQRFDWPGNVRQLENTLFRAIVLAENTLLSVEDFPHIAAHAGELSEVQMTPAASAVGQQQEAGTKAAPPAADGDRPAADGDRPAAGSATATGPALPESSNHIAALTHHGEMRKLDEIEADVIRLALQHYGGHMSEIARRLGIGRSTLYRKVRELGLEERVSA